MLEATERHRGSKAGFQLGGNAEAARGKRRRKRREMEATTREEEGSERDWDRKVKSQRTTGVRDGEWMSVQ